MKGSFARMNKMKRLSMTIINFSLSYKHTEGDSISRCNGVYTIFKTFLLQLLDQSSF